MPDMQMPKPSEEQKKIERLAGTFIGEEKMFPSQWDPKGGVAIGRFETRIALDGFSLVTDYTTESGGQIVYRGHGLFAWDKKDGAYRMYWFDVMNPTPNDFARGRLDGDTLVFDEKGEQGRHRFTYGFEGDGAFTMRIDTSQDGKEWKPMMQGRYTRK